VPRPIEIAGVIVRSREIIRRERENRNRSANAARSGHRRNDRLRLPWLIVDFPFPLKLKSTFENVVFGNVLVRLYPAGALRVHLRGGPIGPTAPSLRKRHACRDNASGETCDRCCLDHSLAHLFALLSLLLFLYALHCCLAIPKQ
jgi:hypothetical protein